ncbi:MAG: archaetidylserine decarboxylase [Spirochaetia bacterium]|nr:archaetidylserine decarboxylase [Spirochaetia bacterium]
MNSNKYIKNPDIFHTLLVCALSLAPLRLISNFFGRLARQKSGKILPSIISIFIRTLRINISEALLEQEKFETFNDFFSRRLKKNAREIDSNPKSVVSPVDGTILSFGSLNNNIIIEAKGTGSNIEDLLVIAGFKKRFIGGDYIVIYLSPRDYHRIHSPVAGKIMGYSHIPGRLYPVNRFAVNNIDRLFSTNERIVTYIECDNHVCALVKVGATNVGSIRLSYKDSVRTNRIYRKKTTDIFINTIPVKKGDEVAWFEIGSTVILLFEKDMVRLNNLKMGEHILMGTPVAKLR